MKKLTIGMATYDDFDGVYFTIQSIRLFHKEICNDIEFIVLDNNPSGKHSDSVKKLCDSVNQPIQYIACSEYSSTSVRNKIFSHAKTPYVLCLDCHVLVDSGAIKKLIDFYESKKDQGNLLQGPLLYDDHKHISTHFDLKWRSHMWGTWETDKRGLDPDSEPFEIQAQGLGLFSCAKDSWLGFNDQFRGFGGEEGYIHEKYRMNGKKTLCLPFLRWVHRFGRPTGVPYPISLTNKIRNYIIAFTDLNIQLDPVYEHFKECISKEAFSNLVKEVIKK